jgi:hypothetical protein
MSRGVLVFVHVHVFVLVPADHVRYRARNHSPAFTAQTPIDPFTVAFAANGRMIFHSFPTGGHLCPFPQPFVASATGSHR